MLPIELPLLDRLTLDGTAIFVSDLHLLPQLPHIADAQRQSLNKAFDVFVDQIIAKNIDHVFILGDLFEAWLGDDCSETFYPQAMQSLAKLKQRQQTWYFQWGNRDFLIGQDFVQQTGCQLLADTCHLSLNGQDYLLLHGDHLCLADSVYIQVRQQLRTHTWQAQCLAMPVAERLQMAMESQERSNNHQLNLVDLDVDDGALTQLLANTPITTIIHGHTHRPKLVESLAGKSIKRYTLGNWRTVMRDDNTPQIDTLGLTISPTQIRFAPVI